MVRGDLQQIFKSSVDYRGFLLGWKLLPAPYPAKVGPQERRVFRRGVDPTQPSSCQGEGYENPLYCSFVGASFGNRPQDFKRPFSASQRLDPQLG